MIKVLYVDDEEGLLEIGKTFLEMSAQLHVDVASSANAAMSMISRERFDAIVSDYLMPETNDIDFLKMLRSQGNNIPFVLFTGKGREEVVIEALNSGADFYLQKGGNPVAQFVELEYKVKEAVRRYRAEKALNKNEQRLRKAHSIGHSGCWEYDLVGQPKSIWISKEGLDVFGLDVPSGDVPLEAIKGCVTEWDKAERAFTDLMEKGNYYDVEFTIRPPNASPSRVIKSVAELERDAQGNPVRVVGLVKDITEKKKAEDALRRSESKLRAIFNEASVGIVSVDEQGRPIEFNDQTVKLFGYSREELMNLKISELIHPEDQCVGSDQFQDLQAGRIDHFGMEKRYLKKDGGVLWAHVTVTKADLGTEETPLTILVISDITGKKQVEEDLKASKLQLTMAMDLALLVYWEYDPFSDVYPFNDRFYALYGTNAEQEGGYSMSKEEYYRRFIHPDDIDHVEKMAAMAPDYMGNNLHFDHRVIRRDGEVRHFNIFPCQIKDGNGKMLKVFGVNQDITEIIKAEKDLRRSHEMLNLLSSITRHDINNQLTVQRAQLELTRGLIHNPDALARLRRMEDSILTVQKQIAFTSDYEQIGAVSPRWQRLEDVLRELPDLKDVSSLEVDSKLQDLTIYADPMFPKVFHNLFENSVKYGGRPLSVRIGSIENGHGLKLTYEDEGAGISREEKEKLFEKGFGRGTGLGLFLSKEILALTGMTILESGEPGKGVRFEISVPPGHYRFGVC